ncbi:DNA-binding response regulator [Rathayibacter sp. AY1E9]|uniref:response regulator n=1 Tax=unclassified Rathayibacter TaxID=2609250 RepID=UPI000CE829C3|nr:MULTISPECIES: response regulator [unclassified Rathayibacter]PPF15456.1 DNA-binding response regulator [Rathayibacter sp. AY1A4]PPG33018.1 DNA-binding response regulator [Rathayibacter sp. AY2B9]PPG54657.1 DNA-binding response regulator [Rathayibacter sp. AY1E9]PPG59221.1 DNA-binding response regulator [Rathayibacter sp. AY1C5]PPH03289.1 DNA-binding response regulator [Rathayibacter sp. AY1H3]
MSDEPAITLAILDDHPILLAALAEWIRRSGTDIRVAATAGTWTDLLAHPAFPTDVVLLDIDLGDELDLAMKIRIIAAAGAATIIISTHSEPGTISRALEAGAHGYVVKSERTETILAAIRAAARDERFLTAQTRELLGADRPGTLTHREREIVRLFVDGMPLKQVATLLGITQDAARSSLRSARGKYRAEGLAVGTKISLRRQALRDGIVER